MKSSGPIFMIGLLAIVLLGVGGWFLFAGPVDGAALFGMDHGPTGEPHLGSSSSLARPVSQSSSAQPPRTVVVEVSAGSPFVAEEVIAELETGDGVRDIKPLLVTETSDGTMVFGVDVQGPLQLPANSRLLTASILEGGRGFNANEGESSSMLVGRTFAETYNTPFGYKILEMVEENHKPFYFLEGGEFVIQGVYTTGDATADAGIVLPLAVAQKLYGLEGKATNLYITVDVASAEAVEKALQTSLATDADITLLQE